MNKCMICILVALYAILNVLPAAAWMRPQNKIPLKEIVNKPVTKSSAICESVDVELYATSIEIHFNANLGNLTVEVTNQEGVVVFQEKLNATTGSALIVPTQNWASGTYSIRILNELGNGCEGQFVITKKP